jgi:hypothetical protein
LIDLFYDDDSYLFARQDRSETVIVAINRAAQEKQIAVPVSSIGLPNGSVIVPLIGTGGGGRVANGQATLTVAAKTAVAFSVR